MLWFKIKSKLSGVNKRLRNIRFRKNEISESYLLTRSIKLNIFLKKNQLSFPVTAFEDLSSNVYIHEISKLHDISDEEYIYLPDNDMLNISDLRHVIMATELFALDFVIVSHSLKELPQIKITSIENNIIYKKSIGINFWKNPECIAVGKVLRLMPDKDISLVHNVHDIFQAKVKFDEGYISLTADPKKMYIDGLISLKKFNKSKKLVFVWPIFLAIGGVEHNTIEIIKQLKDQYHFIVITMERHLEAQGSLHYKLVDVAEAVIDLAEISSQKYFLNILMKLQNVYQPDLIWICNGCPWLADNAMQIRKVFYNTPIVDQQVYDTKEGWVARYREEGIQSFDKFIAISQKIYELFINEFQMKKEAVSLIYPAADTGLMLKRLSNVTAKDVDEMRVYCNLPVDNKKVFVFIGRLAEQKRPLHFVKLAQEHPEINFLMLGTGPLAEDIDIFLTKHKLSNFYQIKYTEKNIAEVFSIADALVMVSAYEGLPMVLIESLICGVPVFSTDVGDNEKIINEYSAGMIIPNTDSVKEINTGFNSFLNNLEKYSSNASKSSMDIALKFSSENISKQYADLFNSAIL